MSENRRLLSDTQGLKSVQCTVGNIEYVQITARKQFQGKINHHQMELGTYTLIKVTYQLTKCMNLV